MLLLIISMVQLFGGPVKYLINYYNEVLGLQMPPNKLNDKYSTSC